MNNSVAWLCPDAGSPPMPVRIRKRAKVLGSGKHIPLDREAKTRLDYKARSLVHAKEIGRTAYLILKELLWKNHNQHSGFCFPSYKTIAKAVGCAASTAKAALKSLEQVGLLTWVHRLVKDGWRMLRSSNSYRFFDPKKPSKPTESENRTGINNQMSPSPQKWLGEGSDWLAGLSDTEPEEPKELWRRDLDERWGRPEGWISF